MAAVRWSAGARPGQIVPVDSEHSALAQCLRGGPRPTEVRRLVLTASGGPFRGCAAADLPASRRSRPLAHPTWTMGPMITVELRDAGQQGSRGDRGHLLFGIGYERIEWS